MKAINLRAVMLIRYGVWLIKWAKEESGAIDKKAKKQWRTEHSILKLILKSSTYPGTMIRLEGEWLLLNFVAEMETEILKKYVESSIKVYFTLWKEKELYQVEQATKFCSIRKTGFGYS